MPVCRIMIDQANFFFVSCFVATPPPSLSIQQLETRRLILKLFSVSPKEGSRSPLFTVSRCALGMLDLPTHDRWSRLSTHATALPMLLASNRKHLSCFPSAVIYACGIAARKLKHGRPRKET